ncbi:hypothetical protein RM572_00365 [Streptomyces sp. DSM 42041]|uniref:Tail terminator n=1 Tax=Streptomyces hazeniae TaxID=3075538 RepID=A0ABU2NJR1_9ACTN|nr:hypothetical protein [Streptomyces sp. DSM 42041]MDT0377229.1 hypothetical protein [Streptomyces sp. DSM 42041]
MGLPITTALDRLQSHAMRLGVFERVRLHEPKTAPGKGITCAIWADSVTPVRSSGLNSTSVRLVLNVRLYAPMLADREDSTDRDLTTALDRLLAAYTGDFDLGGAVRHIDLLGTTGEPLGARAGYLEIDRKFFRVYTITLPLVVNDAWTQGA